MATAPTDQLFLTALPNGPLDPSDPKAGQLRLSLLITPSLVTTPLAAPFNVVPVMLLGLKDEYAVIKAQAPLAAIIFVANLALMYFCYQYALAVYLDWFPTYLNTHRGFNLTQMGFYASLPLLAGTVGDLAGGWFSDRS